ncbi:tetratricopeptide repeat protein [Nevskia ramosa]|uniref:tetratricopeptide repeat protein n=1 Tax=Nevskia ramosa TaxID=64002 RepID=UPI002357E4DF|nr:tetratricopeptide repeat protein [Nevskia ramosa]
MKNASHMEVSGRRSLMPAFSRLAVLAAFGLASIGTAIAQTAPVPQQRPPARQTPAQIAAAKEAEMIAAGVRTECLPSKQKATPNLSDDVIDDMREASVMLGEKKTDLAIEKLKKLVNKGEDYDKAMVNYNLGIAYSDKNDLASSASAFAKALSYDSLSMQNSEQMRLNLGQLYVASGQFDLGIDALRDYMTKACGVVSPDAHVFLASALAERKRFPEALAEVDTALGKSKVPKESWIQFKLGLLYEQKDYKASAETLLQLIALNAGKADYWKQLAGVLLQMEDSTQAAAVLALAERQGMLASPEDIRNLYNTYMIIGEPQKAAQLMDAAISDKKLPLDEKNLESVSNAWINARENEKAEATLKQLASMAERGEYYFRLGAMYGDQERWKDSREMLERALEKGGLKKPGEAWFRIAVASYGANDVKGAIAALQKSIAFEDTKAQASEWLRSLSTQAPPPVPSATSSSAPSAPAKTAG